MIENANIIDLETGDIVSGQNVVIRHDSIIDVTGDSYQDIYEAKTVIDGSKDYLLPGFWDMHVHFGGGKQLIEENKNLLPLYLAHGITTVRDCAADLTPSLLTWRDEINQGSLLGPTIFMSGPKIEGINSIWEGDLEVGTVEELKQAFDSLVSINIDFIKITDNTLSPTLFIQALQEAKKRNYPATGHIPFSLTMQEVAEAGLSAVEHLSYAVKAGSSKEKDIISDFTEGKIDRQTANQRLYESFDPYYASQVYKMMARHGMAIVPTLTLGNLLAHFDESNRWQDDYLKYIGPGLQKTYEMRINRIHTDQKSEMDKRRADYKVVTSTLPLLYQAGVEVITGTDAGYLNSFVYPGLGLHEEMELMGKAGMSNLAVLQSTIVAGPKFLKKRDYCSIEKNKKADLVLLGRNPVIDIKNTRTITGVITKGKYLNRQDLDQLLEDIANQYHGNE